MLLLRRARALHRHLAGAVAGSDRGVHQARVATRRLREAVPVLTSGVKGARVGKARRKIRRLTRALGTVRELDVAVQILDELAQRGGMPRPAIEDVRAHVLAERDRRQGIMRERLDRIDRTKLGRRLTSMAAALQESAAEGWREALASRLVKRARALRSAIAEAGQIYAPERLHEVRIAAKKLRYGLEIAAESGLAAARPMVRTLKHAQNTLGRLNDLQVLLAHVAAVQLQRAEARALPNAGLEMMAAALEEECRHLHGRYLSAAPALVEVCDATRTGIVPQLARPRPSRPLKMTLAARPVRRRVAGETR